MMSNNSLPYKRILLKLSGESLMGGAAFGICQKSCLELAKTIKTLCEYGVQVAIVVGGGNIFRGIHLQDSGLERTAADHVGMLATMMNGLALEGALKALCCPCQVMSALDCPKVAASFNRDQAIKLLETGHVLIFVGGTGNPYFTTDTAAALRASEIQADILLKATKVDGIYEKDPKKYPEAKKIPFLTYRQALSDNLQVMDGAALALCRASGIPIFVFNMSLFTPDAIIQTLATNQFGSIVQGD